MINNKHQTVAILVIGNEVLSGRTREANAYLAAQKMFNHGCKLGEIAIVPDVQEAIVSTLNRLRKSFDAVITSGGIGPTHDDITMQAVAEAFNVTLLEHAETIHLMEQHYGKDYLNDGRRRMARLPDTANPIICEQSICPGAWISNVYVLAGVPYIFESQLNSILPNFGDLSHPFIRVEIDVELPESRFAKSLEEIQMKFIDVEIGSYPKVCGNKPCGKICLSSLNTISIQQAEQMIVKMLAIKSNS
ncbi:MAG: molybdopterin-binding protein [Mariprofundaceae bacterium]